MSPLIVIPLKPSFDKLKLSLHPYRDLICCHLKGNYVMNCVWLKSHSIRLKCHLLTAALFSCPLGVTITRDGFTVRLCGESALSIRLSLVWHYSSSNFPPSPSPPPSLLSNLKPRPMAVSTPTLEKIFFCDVL